MELSLGILLAFGAAALAFVALGDFIVERRQIFKTLRRVRAIELSPTDVQRRELAKPVLERAILPALRSIGRLGRRMSPAGVVDRLDKEIVYAGSPVGWDAERILALKVLAVPVFLLIGLGLSRLADFPSVRTIFLLPFLGFVGYYLPEWILRSQSGRRQYQIQRALPDALDLLSITVEAGLGFDAAVARVARESGGPLGEELHRVLQEMQIGKQRSDALRGLGDRSNVPELKSFVLAMIQADVFGISISKVLAVQAKEMRLKRRQRAEEKAQKIPVKILFPLLFCIFPSLFVVILGPAGISIYHSVLQK